MYCAAFPGFLFSSFKCWRNVWICVGDVCEGKCCCVCAFAQKGSDVYITANGWAHFYFQESKKIYSPYSSHSLYSSHTHTHTHNKGQTHRSTCTFLTAHSQGQQVHGFPQCLRVFFSVVSVFFPMLLYVNYRYVQMGCEGFISTFIKNSCQQMSNLHCCWHLNTAVLCWTKSYKNLFRGASENRVNPWHERAHL